MRKKILFMVINMNVGGTEKALLNMINEMPENKYEITIFMLQKYGGFLKCIPDRVSVNYLKNYDEISEILNRPPKYILFDFLKKFNIINLAIYFWLFFISAIKKERSCLYRFLLRNYEIDQVKYDVAVAYAGPMDFISFFIVEKVKAKKKYQWIHFDVNKIGFNVNFASRYYNKFDKVFVVSKEGKKKLDSKLPSIKNNTEEFLNVLAPDYIIQLAKEGEGFQDNFKGIRILTVGRLSKEKGQDLTIPVLAQLKQDGFNVRWYCIGEGKARNEYETIINKYDIEKDFILLGSKSNPYPYMQQCDLYVQPSRHEGYCITLAEAKCFKVPIVSTKFTGVNEHLIHGMTGLLVEGDSNSIYKAVKEVITDSGLKNELINNLSTENFNEGNRIKKIDL